MSTARKKVRTCYITDKAHKLISSTGFGNFSAGLDNCAKEFAQFARGSDHYIKSIARIKRDFSIKKSIDFNRVISEAVADGHHLQGLLSAIICMISDQEITIDNKACIKKGANWID